MVRRGRGWEKLGERCRWTELQHLNDLIRPAADRAVVVFHRERKRGREDDRDSAAIEQEISGDPVEVLMSSCRSGTLSARLRKKLYELRAQTVTEKTKDSSQFKKTRKDLARVLTERSARMKKATK